MTYKTHFLGGICAVAVASSVTQIENLPLVVGISAFSALIPDIDEDSSKLGRKLGGISTAIQSAFGHRGFIHAPILYLVISMILYKFAPISVAYGFFLGTFSHLILDTFNYKGIMWLYPLTKRHFHIMSIKTRGFGETIFTICMLVFSVFFFLNQKNYIDLNSILNIDFSTVSIDFPTVKNTFISNVNTFVNALLTF